MTDYIEFAPGVNMTQHILDQLPTAQVTKAVGHVRSGGHLWLLEKTKDGWVRQYVTDPARVRMLRAQRGYLSSGFFGQYPDITVTSSEVQWSEDGYEYIVWGNALKITVTSELGSEVVVRSERPVPYRYVWKERRRLWRWRLELATEPIAALSAVKFSPEVQKEIDDRLKVSDEGIRKAQRDQDEVQAAWDAAIATPVVILDENRTSTVDVRQRTDISVTPYPALDRPWF